MKKKILIALAVIVGLIVFSSIVAPDWTNEKIQNGMNNAEEIVGEE